MYMLNNITHIKEVYPWWRERVILNIHIYKYMLCFELLGCKERSSHRPRSNASVLLGKHVVRHARGRRNEENIRLAYINLHFDWITSFTSPRTNKISAIYEKCPPPQQFDDSTVWRERKYQFTSKSYILFVMRLFTWFAGVDMDNDVITCPVPYGGMLLFNNLTPHRRFEQI